MSCGSQQWPSRTVLVAPGCGGWTLCSPGSNLSSAPCSPWTSGRVALDGGPDYTAAGLDLDTLLQRAKRARLASPVQSCGQGSAAPGQPTIGVESGNGRSFPVGSIYQVTGVWPAAAPSDYVAFSASGSAVSNRLPNISDDASVFVAPSSSSGSFLRGARGVFVGATAAAQPFPALVGLPVAQQPTLQRSYSSDCDSRAFGWGWDAPLAYAPCVEAPHCRQAPAGPPTVMAAQPSGLSAYHQLGAWAPAGATAGAAVTGQLALPFVFMAGPPAAPQPPSLQQQQQQPPAALAQPAWALPAPCAPCAGGLGCAPLALGTAQYCVLGDLPQAAGQPHGTLGPAAAAAQPQPVAQPLQAARLSCPVAPPLRAARCPPCQPTLAPLLLAQQPQQPLPQPHHPPQQQQAAPPPPQPPSQLVRRPRPLSPAPHMPSSPPRSPACLGPEDWILHVVACLGLSGADTPSLALHCWRRVAELPQLHHASRLWPSVAAGKSLYATACLWVSIKLEEKRRAAPGGVVLAHMAAATPGALCSAELAVMNWLGWRPYDGFRLDESHLLVYM